MVNVIYLDVRHAILTDKRKKAIFIWFPYNMETVRRLHELPRAYFLSTSKEWEVPIEDFDLLMQKFEDYGIGSYNDCTEIISKVSQYRETKGKNKSVNEEIECKTKLFKHQVEAIEFAKTHNCFLLADDQGLGKTLSSSVIAASRKNSFKHCLIICGVNGLKWNWLSEINQHTYETAHIIGTYTNKKNKLVQGDTKRKLEDLDNLPNDFFIITNQESLRNKDIVLKLQMLVNCGEIGMIIIDEFHKLKNSQSQAGKAIHKLQSYYKIALTGTPLMNNAIDLYNVLYWLGYDRDSLTRFKLKYCIMGGFGGREILGYKNLDKLQELLSTAQLRRKKEDVLDLPPKIRSIDYIELGKEQQNLYNDIRDELITQIDEIMISPNPLAKLIRLRQITGHPQLLAPDIKDDPKMDRLEELVDEIVSRGNKVIIFSNWEQMVAAITNRLNQYNPLTITGDVKDEQRMYNIRLFQETKDNNVIVGTIGAMGTGYTLNKASYVIFMDSPWNDANKAQAEDRAHRIGTAGTVNVVTLVAKDTIDEEIEKMIEGKRDLSDYIVDGQLKTQKKDVLQLLGILSLQEDYND